MSSSTKKRKFGDEAAVASTKYYAVRKGHMPGVYTDYKDCLENTTGFKGAICKLQLGTMVLDMNSNLRV